MTRVNNNMSMRFSYYQCTYSTKNLNEAFTEYELMVEQTGRKTAGPEDSQFQNTTLHHNHVEWHRKGKHLSNK